MVDMKFTATKNRAVLEADDLTLTVSRNGNGTRYRADLFGTRRAFLDVRARGAERNRLKKIINGDEAEARALLAELVA